MLCGLEALRVRRFTHRDIKPENVLYDQSTGVYKLTDFGCAEDFYKIKQSERGSFGYILPKKNTTLNFGNWGHVNDKYGIGVVAWVAKYRKFPYSIPDTWEIQNGDHHILAIKNFMKSFIPESTTQDVDLNRIRNYFVHEVIPMFNLQSRSSNTLKPTGQG